MTERSAAGPVVGIVGGGQLARMLAEAATPMGIHVRVLAAPGDEGAVEVVPDVQFGEPHDPAALASFAATVDVVTFDHENVDHEALALLQEQGVAVRPGVETLRFSDKAYQRAVFSSAGLPVPPFAVVDPVADQATAEAAARAFAAEHADAHGRVVAKASRGGYDGRGVWVLDGDELSVFIGEYDGAPLVLEPLLALESEVAVLVARRPSGEVRAWPVFETVQVNGMCDEVYTPATLDEVTAGAADRLARSVAEVTGAVGVIAVELFLTDGRLLVNEIAPRVHNSGHLTIDGTDTSQFQQHLRAVLDWPLGPCGSLSPVAVMVNVVGGPDGDPRERQSLALAEVPHARLHLYGKTSRPDRKIGHVTVLGDDLAEVRAQANRAARLLAGTDRPVVTEAPVWDRLSVEGSADG
ncbi:MAG: 5-(carboxyamino)imidazole ribonucleotide synthase [Microthrixaceae bacterium]